jgi:bifunctional non-homologous end joining protein LigD
MAYASFEGDIPRGEYGGGHVSIWDSGSYELLKWREREVKVVLHGKRVDGTYVFFRTDGQDWMVHRVDPPPEGWTPLPTGIAPMLATTGPLPADDGRWSYEVKWDGVRALVAVEGGRVTLTSRNGNDITAAYPSCAASGSRSARRPRCSTARSWRSTSRAAPTSGGCSRGCTPASPRPRWCATPR